MKIKIVLSLLSFFGSFFVALGMLTIADSIFLSNSSVTPNNCEKVYSFLLNDKKILREMSGRFIEGDENRRKNWKTIEEYYELRASRNTTDLPEDFRYAWERKILSEIEWVKYADHLRNFNKKGTIETQAEKDIADEKIANDKYLSAQFRAVSSRYGIVFDTDGNLIEK